MAKGDPGGMPGGGGQSSYLNAFGSGMSAGADQGSGQQQQQQDDGGMDEMLKMLMGKLWPKQPLQSSNPMAGQGPQGAPSLPQGFNSGDVM